MNEKLKPTEQKTGLSARVAAAMGRTGLVGQKVAKSETPRDAVAPSVLTQEGLANVRAGLERSSRMVHLGLGGDERAKLHTKEPIAHRKIDNSTDELLTHLVFVGNSVLGVSQKRSTHSDLKEVAVTLLPIGINAYKPDGTRNKSATVLGKIDGSARTQPRHNGSIKTWEKIAIDRAGLTGLGNEDGTVSGRHAEVTIDIRDDFLADVHDMQSTNGTEVFDLDSITGIKPGEDLEAAADLIDALQAEPYLWSVDSADKQVVLPS